MSPQNERLLSHLKRFKTVTTKQATDLLGIYRLSERIRELKWAGYKIDGYMVKVPSRWGGSRVMRYYYVGEK